MTTFDPYASSRETTEGTVFSVTGGDWDSLVSEIGESKEERIIVNMGPQHPSTHGVLRLVLELEGETVTEVRTGIGYLHTGIEKNIEFRNWTQAVTLLLAWITCHLSLMRLHTASQLKSYLELPTIFQSAHLLFAS